MKKFFLLPVSVIFLYLNTMVLNAQELGSHIKWIGDYDIALKTAVKTDKPLMVLLVSSNQASKNMVGKSFASKNYVHWLNKNFVCVLINKEYSYNYPIEMFYTLTYPTLFFLSNHEVFLTEPIVGFISSIELNKELQKLK